MMNNFEQPPALAPTQSAEAFYPGCLTEFPFKHRRPKNKKKAKKAMRKAEHERDQILVAYGYVVAENELLKRSMALAVAVSRKRFDDDLGDDTLRLLPPKGKKK